MTTPFIVQLGSEVAAFSSLPDDLRTLAHEKLEQLALAWTAAPAPTVPVPRLMVIRVGPWRCVCEIDHRSRTVTLVHVNETKEIETGGNEVVAAPDVESLFSKK